MNTDKKTRPENSPAASSLAEAPGNTEEPVNTEVEIPEKEKAESDYFMKVSGNRAFGMAFDKDGSMYMVTAPPTGSGTLSKVSPAGEIEKVCTLDGIFIGPGIDIDKDGNIYVTVGNKLLKIKPDGTKSTLADGFIKCFDVKLDDKGNLYVADDTKDTIYQIMPDGEKKVIYKGTLEGSFILTGLAFDKDYENLYAAEKDRVLKFKRLPDGGFEEPVVIAKDIKKLFFVGVDSHNTVYFNSTEAFMKLEEDGTVTELLRAPLLVPISFKFGGLGFNEQAIYIADGNGIYRYNP